MAEAKGTVGAMADAAAAEQGIAGTAFTFKADGVVLDRIAKATELGKVGVLELVEISLAESPAATAG